MDGTEMDIRYSRKLCECFCNLELRSATYFVKLGWDKLRVDLMVVAKKG